MVSYAQNKPFEVLLSNGVTVKASIIEIMNRGEENCHLLIDKSQNIPINLVSAFENTEGFHIVKEIPEKGPSIFQRTMNGAISIFVLTTNTWYKSTTGGGGLQTEKHQLYLFNNELKKLTQSNLKKDLKDNPELTLRIKKLSRQHLVRTVGFAGSIGLMGWGFGEMLEYNPATSVTEFNFKMNPPFLAGIGVLVGTVAFTNKPTDSLAKIIQTYNYQQEVRKNED
jgi:hypothetical protein